MAHPARPIPNSEEETANTGQNTSSLAQYHPHTLPPTLPLVLNAHEIAPQPLQELRLVPPPVPQPVAPRKLIKKRRKKEADVLRGIKDLQQLQKQTIAVLEAVKGTLDDISQVLRSPEATRGMERQQNAATLLSKGFAREAVEQAQGAVALLPANPEAHLLLSLSLAADRQFDQSLAAARKGLALFDRRVHPLAIEAGLLHALAALGCGAEAVERWTAIIDALPLPVLFEHMRRIGACFPAEVSGGGDAVLDELLNRRLARDEQQMAEEVPSNRPRVGTIAIRPDEMSAETLFTGLDAAKDFRLLNTHRAILGQIARRLQLIKEAGDTLKFLTECVVPLGNRGLDQSAEALARASVKRLHRLHADAMTLHRALGKYEMAGTKHAHHELGVTLSTWRKLGNRIARAKRGLRVSLFLMSAGMGGLAYVLWGMNAIGGASPGFMVAGKQIPAIWIGPAVAVIGGIIGLISLLNHTWEIPMPHDREQLKKEELKYLNTSEVKNALRGAFNAR